MLCDLRVIEHSNSFVLEYFFSQIKSQGGSLNITGSSGVAAAWGFYYYLSQYCNASISWAGNQLNIPDMFPELPVDGVKVTSNDRYVT